MIVRMFEWKLNYLYNLLTRLDILKYYNLGDLTHSLSIKLISIPHFFIFSFLIYNYNFLKTNVCHTQKIRKGRGIPMGTKYDAWHFCGERGDLVLCWDLRIGGWIGNGIWLICDRKKQMKAFK